MKFHFVHFTHYIRSYFLSLKLLYADVNVVSLQDASLQFSSLGYSSPYIL